MTTPNTTSFSKYADTIESVLVSHKHLFPILIPCPFFSPIIQWTRNLYLFILAVGSFNFALTSSQTFLLRLLISSCLYLSTPVKLESKTSFRILYTFCNIKNCKCYYFIFLTEFKNLSLIVAGFSA